MYRFAGFLIKEFRHIFRDKRTIIILFGMPLIQIMLFGYAITSEIRNANIAILDEAKDSATRELTQKLLSSGYFRLYAQLHSAAEIEKAFQTGKVKLVIHFQPGFANRLEHDSEAPVQILADASDPNTSSTLVSYINGIFLTYVQELNRELKIPLQIVPEIRMRYNPEMKSVYFFVPGLITIILMLVSAMMTSIAITREKEMGTMEILLVSPIRPYQIILGKVLPYLLLSLTNASVILLLGYFVFGVPIRGSLLILIAECILFIITALSLGIFISTVAKSQQAAMLMSLMGLMMPTILLSGFIFPIENMPIPMQVISNILPAKWFIKIVRSIMLKGSDWIWFWKETLVLCGMTFFFIGMSVRRFQIRLEKN